MQLNVANDPGSSIPQAVAAAREAVARSDRAKESQRGPALRATQLLDRTLDVWAALPTYFMPVPRWHDDLRAAVEGVASAFDSAETSTSADTSAALTMLANELMMWPAPVVVDPGEAGRIASVVRRATDSEIKRVRDDADEVGADLANARREVVMLRDELRSLRDDLELEGRAERAELDAALTAGLATTREIQAKVANANESVQNAVRRFDEGYTASQRQRDEMFRTAQQSRETDFEDTLESFKTRGEKSMTALEAVLEKAGVLQKLLASAATANRWGGEADSQRTPANGWRLATVGLGIASVGTVLAVILASGDDVGPWTIAGRLSLGLLLTALTGYAASQSAHHRSRESEARDKQLKLETFEPFLQELPPEVQAGAREWFVQSFFGVELPPDRTATETPERAGDA